MKANTWPRALFASALLLSLNACALLPQDQEKDTKDAKPAEKSEPTPAPKEEFSVTEHSLKIAGQTIPYKATAGSILLKNDKDEPEALIYYTAYTRTDAKDPSLRPIAFLYNGGPGSSSLWLHMGSFGPKRVLTANAGITPPAPYKLEDNPNCLLDKSDLVFIDPVGTGFSKAVGKAQDKDFWVSIRTPSLSRNSCNPMSPAMAAGIPPSSSSAKATVPSAMPPSPISFRLKTASISTAS